MSAVRDRLAQAGLAPLPPAAPPAGIGRSAVAARGRALATARAALPEARLLAAGLDALSDALRRGDPGAARCAGLMLTGLGPGLTPLGDDVLVGAIAAVDVLGPAAGLAAPTARELADELTEAARQGRTSSLSAELIVLAARGWAIPPLHELLDLSPSGERGWRASLWRLERVGATSGRGCALGVMLACAGLAQAVVPVDALSAPAGT